MSPAQQALIMSPDMPGNTISVDFLSVGAILATELDYHDADFISRTVDRNRKHIEKVKAENKVIAVSEDPKADSPCYSWFLEKDGRFEIWASPDRYYTKPAYYTGDKPANIKTRVAVNTLLRNGDIQDCQYYFGKSASMLCTIKFPDTELFKIVRYYIQAIRPSYNVVAVMFNSKAYSVRTYTAAARYKNGRFKFTLWNFGFDGCNITQVDSSWRLENVADALKQDNARAFFDGCTDEEFKRELKVQQLVAEL